MDQELFDTDFESGAFLEEDMNDINEDDIETIDERGNINFNSNKEDINNQKITEKKTLPFLTKYEKARIIGLRTQQLSTGAIPMIDTDMYDSALEVAEEELKQRKIPFIIRRVLPNGEIEDWKIEEFKKVE